MAYRTREYAMGFVAVELEWQQMLTIINSVVIRNGKWYIANYGYNLW